MDIETVHRAYTPCGQHRGELLHFPRRGAKKHDIGVDAIEAIVVMINTCQLHIRSGINGLFGRTTYIAVP